VTGTPCELAPERATTWNLGLYLEPELDTSVYGAVSDGMLASRFEIRAELRDARLAIGGRIAPRAEGGEGFVCCGATRFFKVVDVPEEASLQIEYRTTVGRVEAVFAKWGFCPTAADVDRSRGRCDGFCAMSWLTTKGSYSGTLYSENLTTLKVPWGDESEPDKRRGGDWYVGVRALPGELAEFELSTSLVYPIYRKGAGATICNKLTAACGYDSARGAWNQSGPPAPPPSAAALEMLSAQQRGTMSLSKLASMLWDGLVRKVLPFTLAVTGVILFFWCFRTYRTRQRRRFRLPHDEW